MIPLKDDTPCRTTPYVTVALIAANVAVFLYQLTLSPHGLEVFVYSTAAVPYEITHLTDIFPASAVPPPFTVFTAMFVHAGLVHLGGNMLFLWIFGDNIEDVFGHIRFLLFYLVAGAVASLFHILSDPGSLSPMIGASGAVAGVLGAYFLIYPRARVLTLVFLLFFVTVVRVPAVVFLALWFLIQVFNSGYSNGTAWFAHIGGFVAGGATVLVLAPHRLDRGFRRR